MVLWLKLDSDMLKLLSAVIVAIFLAIPYWKGKYFRSAVKPATESAEAKDGGETHA